MVKASASEAGGRGFEPGPHHTIHAKMVPVATLRGAQHHKVTVLLVTTNVLPGKPPTSFGNKSYEASSYDRQLFDETETSFTKGCLPIIKKILGVH